MIDYSIDKYIIKNNQTLQFDDLDNFDRVKQVFIASVFDVSHNCANHFNGMKSLERFEVLDKHSRSLYSFGRYHLGCKEQFEMDRE